MGSGEVIVSAGGGVVAERLMRRRLWRAFQQQPEPMPVALSVGSNTPEGPFASSSEVRPRASSSNATAAISKRLLGNCGSLISQAGYNTVLEVLVSGAPAVLAPFGDGHEREQSLRARGRQCAHDTIKRCLAGGAHCAAPGACGRRPPTGRGDGVAPVIDRGWGDSDGASLACRARGREASCARRARTQADRPDHRAVVDGGNAL